MFDAIRRLVDHRIAQRPRHLDARRHRMADAVANRGGVARMDRIRLGRTRREQARRPLAHEEVLRLRQHHVAVDVLVGHGVVARVERHVGDVLVHQLIRLLRVAEVFEERRPILQVGRRRIARIELRRCEGHHRRHVRHPDVVGDAIEDRLDVALVVGAIGFPERAVGEHLRNQILIADADIEHDVVECDDVAQLGSVLWRSDQRPRRQLDRLRASFELERAVDRAVGDVVEPGVLPGVGHDGLRAAGVSEPAQHDQPSFRVHLQIAERVDVVRRALDALLGRRGEAAVRIVGRDVLFRDGHRIARLRDAARTGIDNQFPLAVFLRDVWVMQSRIVLGVLLVIVRVLLRRVHDIADQLIVVVPGGLLVREVHGPFDALHCRIVERDLESRIGRIGGIVHVDAELRGLAPNAAVFLAVFDENRFAVFHLRVAVAVALDRHPADGDGLEIEAGGAVAEPRHADGGMDHVLLPLRRNGTLRFPFSRLRTEACCRGGEDAGQDDEISPAPIGFGWNAGLGGRESQELTHLSRKSHRDRPPS